MDVDPPCVVDSQDGQNGNGLSYKYQRLREQLRMAVRTGELSGKLPGERLLARKFSVNAKTLSKALTDLAAEGLLDRSIGRGTYVKGAAPADSTRGRWIVLCEADRTESALVRQVLHTHSKAAVISDVAALRPSTLSKFDAILDLALQTPEQFLRDMQVRGMPVVAVDREPSVYSVDTVAVDCALGASCVARDLVLGGHRHIAVVESQPNSQAGRAAKQAAGRYAADAAVTICTSEEALAAIKSGATAVICDTIDAARSVRENLESAGLGIPQDVSLAAIGICDEPYPCSGQYADCASVVQAIAELLETRSAHHPAMVWLVPKWLDQGTTRTLPVRSGEAA
jgi:DNA-binding transcriptional regulator YhcF (GntR family)